MNVRGAAVAERLGQPVKFVLVGAGGYAVNLLAFWALYAAGVPYVVASVAAYLVSNALMYVGNRYFTFRLGHAGFWRSYVRYLAVGLVVVGLNAALLAVLVELLSVPAMLAQAISLLLITPVAFLLNKRWTFALGAADERAPRTRSAVA